MNIGDKAPEILGRDQDGKEVKLADFKGKKLVLYFIRKTIHLVARQKHAICVTIINVFWMQVMP